MTGRVLTLLIAVGAALALLGPAQAASAPVEAYSSYQPQTKCSPSAKPGAKALARWEVASFGGHQGRIGEPCAGRSVSEHKEGRAVDWMLNSKSATDRARASRFFARIFATGTTGERHELARRMGVMYIIWSDRIYASYDGFRARVYRSSSCRSKPLSKCSMTLRHRDHVHISLSRSGGAGTTSFYAGKVPSS
jgi:hypothetical protein